MTPENPIVKDLVIPLKDFPHLNEHQTIHDAVEVLLSYTCGEYDRIRYAEILILNERNQLSGRVMLQDILLNLDPRLKELSSVKGYEGKAVGDPDLMTLWEDSFFVECTKRSDIIVRDVMSPIKHTVKAGDPVLKALIVMITSKIAVLPVVDQNRVVGVIRLKEIFRILSSTCKI